MKDITLKKLNTLLKRYLVVTYETDGYDPEDNIMNKFRSKRAKMIITTIGRIEQDKEIDKEKLTQLFGMYKTYHS